MTDGADAAKFASGCLPLWMVVRALSAVQLIAPQATQMLSHLEIFHGR